MWRLATAKITVVRRSWGAALAAARLYLLARWQGRRAWVGRAASWTALACVLTHGALLRIDAITGRYGPVASPRWLAGVQTRSIAPPEAIRPASISWQPEPVFLHRDGASTRYRSDPQTYLDTARSMSSFYGAHFREPVFPFTTRIALGVLGGQDVAVSFTSAFFSLLAIWLTYLLGAALWSRPIGLLAALGLSLDYDVISLASLGWRDDAYMAAVTLCAYVMLRWWRAEHAAARVYRLGSLRIDAAYMQAVFVGVAGGFAILTRIMAVSFLAAGALYMLVARRTSWRRQLAAVGLAVVTAGLVAGPYFVNCWRVYGDPLYTFNVHGAIYSAAEGEEAWKGSTAAYVSRKIARRPLEALDTVAQGLTSYPFANKWHGLNPWLAGLGPWASMAALAGLAVLAALAQGRLLLVLIIASLAPFSFTWAVDPDFRFTVHVYPFLLIAAAVAIGAGVRGLRAVLVPGRRRLDSVRPRRAWLVPAGVAATALAALWFFVRVSPSLVFAEALRAREDATVTAGSRDAAFFRRGWSELVRGGNVSMRVANDEGALSLRLPAEGDYPATLRMDPFPRPPDDAPQQWPTVEVELNGVPIASIPLQWTPGRVGAYDLGLPQGVTRRGANLLVLRVRGPGAVGLWYVRVHPPRIPTRDP
jgi:4-amino-4-deoxy-L-arabinose transferase-like glycosyltransferase